MKNQLMILILLAFGLGACAQSKEWRTAAVYPDEPFIQDYSIQYLKDNADTKLWQVASDRNGFVEILSSNGLLRPRAGQLLFPGTLVKDIRYRPMSDKNISSIGIYEDQFVYLDDKAVLSNAWAGKLYSRHDMLQAQIFCGGRDFTFLISDGMNLNLLRDSKTLWTGAYEDEIRDIQYDAEGNLFWILGRTSISTFSPEAKKVVKILDHGNLTCMELSPGKLIVGTDDGYLEIDLNTHTQRGGLHRDMPWPELTAISYVDGNIWFGSTSGAMMLHDDGRYSYYASQRWLPSDTVVDIASGPENSVLILTNKGLGKICFKEMTLAEKARFYDDQVRLRHIRVGFNASLGSMTDGDVTTGILQNSDNDGLWTSMYLAGQAFRYSVSKSEEALQNIRESLNAMERLYTINPMNSGFPSRSFERSGYNKDDEPWRPTEYLEWDWKSTTSSDEAIGHVFVFGVLAELVDVEPIRTKAIQLLDGLMQHIIDHDLYLVDWNGKPTTWGRWNPDYVNNFPVSVGDRKLNSSNIIAMLQTAYHFTKKEVYKKKAFELMEDYGYLENLMRPMEVIGKAPDNSDDWSKMLSGSWNHSDDEMYFLGYWGLYRYAFNDDLRAKYKQTILDHWEAERPEKEGLWNIMTGLVGDGNYDFEAAIWYLQKYPLDLVSWTVNNSHRKDIEAVPVNFRGQTIPEVLPPDELPIRRHNANRFVLDGGDDGHSEYSAGDIWLLPYWMGRYLNIIGGPAIKSQNQ